MLKFASVLLFAIALLSSTFTSADILFGTYTPTPTKAGIPSIYGAMNDWLTEKGDQYRQSLRVCSIGWGPTNAIYDQVVQMADYWRFDAAVIVLSWLPEPYKTWTSPTPNEDIASGLYDDYIDQFLGNLSNTYVYANGPSSPRLIYLRFAPQPNANWAPWNMNCPSCTSTGQHINQTAESYINMWKYVIGKARSPKYRLTPDVMQVAFDVSTYDATEPFEKFYPNDGSVNWLSIAGDNFGNTIPGNQWQVPSKLLSQTVARLNALPGNSNGRMPIAISSVATTSSPNGVAAKEQWISSLFEYIATVPNIKMLTYHNADAATDLAIFGGEAGYFNWSSPVSSFSYWTYPAFRTGVTSAPYVGSNSSNPTLITQAQFFGQA